MAAHQAPPSLGKNLFAAGVLLSLEQGQKMCLRCLWEVVSETTIVSTCAGTVTDFSGLLCSLCSLFSTTAGYLLGFLSHFSVLNVVFLKLNTV